jgi:hypothetical protein
MSEMSWKGAAQSMAARWRGGRGLVEIGRRGRRVEGNLRGGKEKLLHKARTARRRLGWEWVGSEIHLNLVKWRCQLEFRENGGDG